MILFLLILVGAVAFVKFESIRKRFGHDATSLILVVIIILIWGAMVYEATELHQ